MGHLRVVGTVGFANSDDVVRIAWIGDSICHLRIVEAARKLFSGINNTLLTRGSNERGHLASKSAVTVVESQARIVHFLPPKFGELIRTQVILEICQEAIFARKTSSVTLYLLNGLPIRCCFRLGRIASTMPGENLDECNFAARRDGGINVRGNGEEGGILAPIVRYFRMALIAFFCTVTVCRARRELASQSSTRIRKITLRRSTHLLAKYIKSTTKKSRQSILSNERHLVEATKSGRRLSPFGLKRPTRPPRLSTSGAKRYTLSSAKSSRVSFRMRNPSSSIMRRWWQAPHRLLELHLT